MSKLGNHWCPVKVKISIQYDFMSRIECFLPIFEIKPTYKNTDRLDSEGARPDERRSDGVTCL
jgi:hypothetical protein